MSNARYPAFLDLAPMASAAGTVRLPGSKSISNRTLLLAALAEGATQIRDLLDSDDTRRMLEALALLGVTVEGDASTGSVVVHGCGGRFPNRDADLFLGNAGTAFRPLTEATVLVKLIAAVALHYLLVGFGLFFFGAEGLRTPPFVSGRIDIGFTTVSWHLVLALASSLVLIVLLWAFFERTLWGKALRATAVNRFGARLVGIRTERAGLLAFGIAGLIGALSGLLIGPIATIYYDSGFLIGLKAFIGVVCAAMASFPIAVAGALAVGVFESFASFFASALKEAIVFVLLVPILLWRSLTDHSLHGEEE